MSNNPLAKSSNSVNQPLLESQEEELFNMLRDFLKWLAKKKILDKKSKLGYYVDMPFADDDWIMKVEGDNVSFNTNLLKRCSFEYFKTILIHEFFHLTVQKLPNKDDATKLKDDFGEQLMKLIDIEADFFTALYFKEELKYGLVEYLKLYYEGRKVFSDKWIRPVKFERFIGTLLSIFKMFVNNENNDNVKTCDLYLPTIASVYTESSLRVLVMKNEHIYVDVIKASYQDFVDLKSCYNDINKHSMRGYIEGLISFSCKAFDISMPPNIKLNIEQIPT